MGQTAFDTLLYGGDYNPEQWMDRPDILRQDLELMKQAGVNTVSVGIFSWSKLEPEEGRYELDWLEDLISRLYENGISVNLATPSGARPRWLAERYPEVLRVNARREKMLYGFRHNHCPTSPIYRKKVRQIDQKLAQRFDSHPGVRLWHLSNEYGGECHCPLCQEAFRGWLEDRYGTIDALNRAWNTAFWSHTLQDFSQVESPSPIGEFALQGLNLDWRRFCTDRCADFIRAEVRALRDSGAKKPVTTNFMYDFNDYNYHRLAEELDMISWDNYPQWHRGDNAAVAADAAMQHDIMRTLKGQPFLLMESAPGATNWTSVSKLPRPGMIEASGLQAVSHGSDSVLYFQIRKSRGGSEKFHAAMIDHSCSDSDRIYQECKKTGGDLSRLAEICGTRTPAQAAVLCDWENRWALHGSQGPRNKNLHYKDCMLKAYRALRHFGLNVDLPDMEQELAGYRIVIAPMLYLFRAGIEEKIRRFTENGGVLILTYWSGVVDEQDLAFLGGTPHGLMDVLGLRSTEIDALYDGEYNILLPPDRRAEETESPGDGFCDREEPVAEACGTGRREVPVQPDDAAWNRSAVYRCEHLCQLVETTTARPLLIYGKDFYAGTPALTENRFGAGTAYYLCADAERTLWEDLIRRATREAGLSGPFGIELPDGIEVTTRCSDTAEYVFIQNFADTPWELPETIRENRNRTLLFGNIGRELNPCETLILKKSL